MYDIKKSEIEQSAIKEITLENELSLKVREIVFLKLSVQENKLTMNGMNKRIKMLVDSHKEMKKEVEKELKEKRQNKEEPTIEVLECLKDMSRRLVEPFEDDEELESIKKQKRAAKKLIN
jgi:uncharacterized protein (DUF849 family)